MITYIKKTKNIMKKSEALKRVEQIKRKGISPSNILKPAYDGIYLSIGQLEKLTQQLKSYNAPKKPDGICFMVGRGESRLRSRVVNTVELIPYNNTGSRDLDNLFTFFKNKILVDGIEVEIEGELMVELGIPSEFKDESFNINNMNDLIIGGGVGQRTPPPPPPPTPRT